MLGIVDFSYGSLLYATFAVAAALSLVAVYRILRMDRRSQLLITLAVMAGFVLFIAQHVHVVTILLLEVGILGFNGLLSGKSARSRAAYVLVDALYIVMIHYIGFMYIAQAMLLGLLSVITKLKEYRNSIEDRRVEISRDFFHMGAGIFLMLMFYFEIEPIAVTFQMLLILGGILVICVIEAFSSNRFSRIITRFERNGSALGYGALWLAIGSLMAVSFLNTMNVLVVFSAIFIGDPVATMVGIHFGGKKIPWNRRKSVYGSMAYFAATSAISFAFIGYYALAIGLVGALVESLRIRIDDNLSVSAALTALLLIIRI